MFHTFATRTQQLCYVLFLVFFLIWKILKHTTNVFVYMKQQTPLTYGSVYLNQFCLLVAASLIVKR